MRAIHVTRFGGPEVLELVDAPDPEPAAGELLIDVTGCGVNYADTHQVENSYLASQTLPFIPGTEVIGRTRDGRRVCAFVPDGGYAERAVVPARAAMEVPDAIGDTAALSLLVQGLTAWHILRSCAHLAPGETVVVHAAAGGVGSLTVQLAKLWGAGRVIAVASTPLKRALAESLGADVTVDAGADDLTGALREANDGAKVDVISEMVGGATFDASLRALAPFGRLVTFGMAGKRPATPIAPAYLMAGSKSVIGFWLAHAMSRNRMSSMIVEPLQELMTMTAHGTLSPLPGHTYPLAEARRAHEDLRARQTTGKAVLQP